MAKARKRKTYYVVATREPQFASRKYSYETDHVYEGLIEATTAAQDVAEFLQDTCYVCQLIPVQSVGYPAKPEIKPIEELP